MKRKSSNNMYGEASKRANIHDIVICVMNWDESSVFISGILYSVKWKSIPFEFKKFSIKLNVTKFDL